MYSAWHFRWGFVAKIFGILLLAFLAVRPRTRRITNSAAGLRMRGGQEFETAAHTTQFIDDPRAGNFNAIVPQVRRRGDAFYNSHYEPKSADSLPKL